MNDTSSEYTVMFADIAGSTRLYEVFGDARAQDMVFGVLSDMADICQCEGGTVVKTVGDEIMCHFPSPDSAVSAACKIQENLSRILPGSAASIAVRIGLHYGPAISEQGDLYGDAVNLAGRMTSIAKAGQIITTKETVGRLSNQVIQTRFFDRANVKGKQDVITVYEVLWGQEDVTRMNVSTTTLTGEMTFTELILKYAGRELRVSSTNVAAIFIGRGLDCDCVIDSNLASRKHAMIQYRRGKFVLIDQSTNGTFVKMDEDGQEFYLRREELPLWGTGNISLGCAVKDAEISIIHYICN